MRRRACEGATGGRGGKPPAWIDCLRSSPYTKAARVSNSDEWYTPPHIFDIMALHFDVDVCAPEGGIPWIPATRYITAIDDALVTPWIGRVWMNPPYSGPGKFVNKWIEHGNGCGLVPLSKSRWFSTLWASAASIVVLRDPHLKFIRNGELKGIFMPTAIIAIGPQENHDAIARLGPSRTLAA